MFSDDSQVQNADGACCPTSGAVYTQTNSAGPNAVLAFSRNSDGLLTALGTFSTGGYGSGTAALASQGSVRLDPKNRLLAVTNAASDQVTAFAVEAGGALALLNTIGSNGPFPISVTLSCRLAYVLNAGQTPTIAGFTTSAAGLSPLSGSVQPLSPTAVGPAEVRFDPDGDTLAVPEKFSNTIDIFRLNRNGLPGTPVQSPSAGVEPFGLAWVSDRRLLDTDATSNDVTLYAVDPSGTLVLAGPVPNFQTAPCWIVLTPDGRFAYTDNAGSGTISSYRVDGDRLTLYKSVAGIIGGAPVDVALSQDGRFLYALNSQTISGFRIERNGELTPITVVPVTAGSVGIAAF